MTTEEELAVLRRKLKACTVIRGHDERRRAIEARIAELEGA